MSEHFKADAAVEAYLPLMHEFAIRSDLVAQACNGQLDLNAPFAREFSYLQFRRMCELIAIGCLHLHGDLPVAQLQSTKKEWNAERLMKALQRSHPYCFPQPIERRKTEQGWHIQANSKSDALTYIDFRALYAECGEVLHRGTIRTAHAATFCKPEDYERVLVWQRKLVTLMNEHLVGRAKREGFYMVSLRTDSGYPECSTFDFQGKGQALVNTKKMTVADDVLNSYVSNNLAARSGAAPA